MVGVRLIDHHLSQTEGEKNSFSSFIDSSIYPVNAVPYSVISDL